MKEQIEHALKQRAGDPEHAEQLNQAFAEADDLYAFCPKCKERIAGTLTGMTQHVEDCDGTRN